jgi:hypothetical protein
MTMIPHITLLLTLFIPLAAFAAPAASRGPETTVREYLRAVYSGDRAAFDRLIVPHPEAHLLIAGERPSAKERKEVAREAASLRLRQLQEFRLRGATVAADRSGDYPVGTMTRYLASFRGNTMVVTIVRRSDGWKIDLRWWLAMYHDMQAGTLAPDTPEYAIRSLLLSMLADERDTARKFVTPDADMSLLFQSAPSQPEPSDVLPSLAVEMPLVTVESGEFYPLPSGEIVEGRNASEETRLLVGLFGMVEIPFVVRRTGAEWRVVPQPYFFYLNR